MKARKLMEEFKEHSNKMEGGIEYYPSTVAALNEFGFFMFHKYLNESILRDRMFRFCPATVNDGIDSERDNQLYVRTVGLLDEMNILRTIYDCAELMITKYYREPDFNISVTQAMEVIIHQIFVIVRGYANKERKENLEREIEALKQKELQKQKALQDFKEAVFFGERRETTVWEELNIQL